MTQKSNNDIVKIVENLVGQLGDSIDDVKENMKEGFNGVHDRQDTTNGRVRDLEKWMWWVIGFCACLSVIVLPVAFLILKAKIESFV
jgi:hypothetical protein